MNSITTDAPPVVVYTQLLVIITIFVSLLFHSRKKSSGSVNSILLIAFVQFLGFVWYSIWFWHSLASGKIGKYIASWHNHFFITEITQYLTSITAGWVAGALLCLLLWFIFLYRGKGRLIDQDDVVAITLGAVAVGWPAVLIFLALTFFLAVLGMLVLFLLRKKSIYDRLVITPFIVPSTIVTLFIGSYLLAITHLDKIRF